MRSGEEKGLIFNIVRGSFVDGPGVRTTVFLKGCPLRCVWCCNPEGQSFRPELAVTYDKCSGCSACLKRCLCGALSIRDGKIRVKRDACSGCGDCVESCTAAALSVYGTPYTVDEIFEIIRKDKPFYDASGGGLTIGGGESTWWPEFVLSLLERCKEAGIHTAIDTCGYVTNEKGMECLENADMLLFDIKGLDPVEHERNTGKRNEVILDTLRKMGAVGKPIIVRIPFIPGYNDRDDMVEAEARLLASVPSIERVDIIPEHEFGKFKYMQIDKEYTLRGKKVSEEKQQELLRLFSSYGLNVQIGG